ncbi:MAG: hypothetical protein J6S40_01995 [Thermoguttaceae bacterium]|nr:hypothetical protein [Thermoguttaceae bacterium]
MSFLRRFPTICLFLTGVFSLVSTVSVSAAEDWESFYDALMNRGYYDVAVTYLESFRNSPSIPDDLATELDNYLGETTLELMRTSATKAERQLYSDQAREYLDRYLSQNGGGEHAYKANSALADLYTEEGNDEQARLQKGLSETERKKIEKTVQDDYAKALDYAKTAVAQAKEAAQRMKSSDATSHSAEAQIIYADYLGLRIKENDLLMKLAETYPEGADDRKSGLETARAAFDALYEKYSKYPGGFKARLLETKAALALGDKAAATEYLDELLALPMSKALYAIKTETILLYGQMIIEKGEAADLFRLMIAFYDWKYANDLPPVFYITAEGLQIHLLAGQAVLKLDGIKNSEPKKYADAAKTVFNDQKPDVLKSVTKLLAKPDKQAYEWFDFVYRQKSPFSAEAEKLLADPVFAGRGNPATDEEPTTFEDAVERLNRAWTNFTQANADAGNALTAETSAKTAARKSETARAVERAMRAAFQTAGRYSAEPGQLDKLRLQWATLNFMTGRWIDAEVLGDFLLYKRGGSAIAPKAAEISLLAAKSAFREGKKNGVEEAELDELHRAVQSRAEYIVQKWGGDLTGDNLLPVVREALIVQMDTAVTAGELDKAKEFLNAIPESSTAYADAAIQFGQSLWSTYIELLNQKNEDPESVADATLQEVLESARASLEAGLKKKLELTSGGRGDDLPTVNAALSLAQIDLLSGRAQEAQEWLLHPNIGPLTLVERRFAGVVEQAAEKPAEEPAESEEASAEGGEAPAEESGESAETESAETESTEAAESNASATQDLILPPSPLSDPFQLSALTLGLRVLVATQDFEHAEKVMNCLELFVSTGVGSEERLTLVYLQLGKQLQEQIQTLRQSGDVETLRSITSGFEGFLDRISARSQGNTYMTLRWVADTYFNFGLGLKPAAAAAAPTPAAEGEEAAPETSTDQEDAQNAAEYFKKAGKTYQTILQRIEAEPEWAASPNAKVATTLRMSESLRELGRFGSAVKVLIPILETNETNLELQTGAALILQEWGKKKRALYPRAIQGAVPRKGGKNLIWGWNRIIALLSRNIDKSPQFKEKFYDAVINKMECRNEWIAGITDPAEKIKQAKGGETELLKLHKLHPDLGGASYKKKLESYLKAFRETAGEPSDEGFPQPQQQPQEEESAS